MKDSPWVVLALAVMVVLSCTWTAQAAEDWRPVDTADLASKTPVVEKDADAEALFWEVRLDDAQTDKTVFKHYLRMKIFTARGVESQSRIDLPYEARTKIADVVARTIKPDGTIIELKKDVSGYGIQQRQTNVRCVLSA